MTYYVANAGSDSNPGTQARPFATVAHALSVAVAGDSVLLNGGDTFAENVTISANNLTLGAYGTGRPILAPTVSDATGTVKASNVAGVVLDGLKVASASGTGNSVYVENTGTTRLAGFTVRDCEVTGANNGVVVLGNGNTANAGFSGVRILDSEIHGLVANSGSTGKFGVYIAANPFSYTFVHSDVLIQNNEVHDVPGGPGQGTGIVAGMCDTSAGSVIVEKNYVHDCGTGTDNAAGAAGIFPIYSDGVIVRKNTVARISSGVYNSGQGSDGAGIDADSSVSNCLFEHNAVYDCEGAGFLHLSDKDGTIVRFNLFANCGTRAIAAGPACIRLTGSGGATVYNNTVVSGPNVATVGIFNANSANKKIYNNILIAANGENLLYTDAALDPTFAMEGNAYRSGKSGGFKATVNIGTTYSSLSAFRSGTGLESANRAVQLQAQPFYRPAPPQFLWPADVSGTTSHILDSTATPALYGQGLDLQALYGIDPGTADLLGNAIPVPYAIGCCNQQAAPTRTGWESAVLADAPVFWGRCDESSTDTSFHDSTLVHGFGVASSLAPAASLVPNDADAATHVAATGHVDWATFNHTFSALTVEFWYRLVAGNGGILFGQWGSTNHFVVYPPDANGGLTIGVTDGSQYLIASFADAATEAGNTFHLAFTWGGGNTLAAYVNGVAQTLSYSNTGTPGAVVVTTLAIGTNDGYLDEVLLYDSALSQARIQAHYNAGLAARAQSKRRKLGRNNRGRGR